MKRILILFGGKSYEHEVSYMSAKSIYENIDKRKYKVENCYLDKNNNFFTVENIKTLKNLLPIDSPVDYLKSFDLVFNIIHGKTGEDGMIQGLLETINVKYVGSTIEGSVLGFNKELSKIIFERNNIPQIPYKVYNKDNIDFEEIKELNYPVIIKPAHGGSSIGINIANNKKQLIKAIKEAAKYDKRIIIEKFIQARELECAIISGKETFISTIGEITYDKSFYDYDTKYFSNKYKQIIPAEIPKNIEKAIKEYTRRAFEAIDAKGLSRVDFLYDEENKKVYLNEINTIPGFTEISMFPKLLIHDKYTFKSLITTIIKNSLY